MKRSCVIVTVVVVALFLTGIIFPHLSEAFNYDKIQALVEANDPVATIVETVREESRIYPRPTKVEVFKEPVFNINSGELWTYVEQIVEQEEFGDIQLIQASTGVHYLYSTQYLDADHAKSLIEWEEVERFRNQ